MPRVISSDARAATWPKWPGLIIKMDFSAKLSLDGMCASKRGVNKIIREVMLDRQGAIKPVEGLGSLHLHPARSASTILKVKNFINNPDPWPLREVSRKLNVPPPSLLSGGFSSKIWGGGDAIQAQISSPVRQDGRSTTGKGAPPSQASHPQQMEKYQEYWWSLVLHVICQWMADVLWVARKKAKKAGGKLVCRSIHVALCSSREWTPLVPLPSVSSFPKQESVPTFTFRKVLKPLFERGHLFFLWERRHFCRAAPRQRPSAHGHRPVARKFRLQFYSCSGLGR